MASLKQLTLSRQSYRNESRTKAYGLMLETNTLLYSRYSMIGTRCTLTSKSQYLLPTVKQKPLPKKENLSRVYWVRRWKPTLRTRRKSEGQTSAAMLPQAQKLKQVSAIRKDKMLRALQKHRQQEHL